MKGIFLLKILIPAVILIISACQKSSADNLNISPSPTVSPSTAPTATQMPESRSSIRKVDFKNFTYIWTSKMISGEDKTFTLKKGEKPFVMNEQMGVLLEKIKYADVTFDGAEEALIDLSVETGGSAVSNMIYVYSMKNKTPELLWSFETGDRADGGFKNFYSQNGELVIETFGDSKFENDQWIFRMPEDKFKGYCCPTVFTKIRFKWNGGKFIAEGKPELFDIQ